MSEDAASVALTTIRRWVGEIHLFIMRRMNERYIQFVCSAFLIIYVAALVTSFLTQSNGRTIFGPNLGADYASFYVAGKIYGKVSPDQIYNRSLHQELYRHLTNEPDPAGELPYANAPFFILPFALLARLPYGWSYLVWMLAAAGLYLAGLRLTWISTVHLPTRFWKTALLLGLTFVPFLLESLTGGQVSAFGVFWLGLSFYLERRQKPILSGVALAFCLYKPTLLILILPMLLITARWRTLVGFSLGALGLAAASVLAVGVKGSLDYAGSLFFFAGQAAVSDSGLRTWKYIDFNSFYRLLFGSYALLRWMSLLLTSIAIAPRLARTWLRLPGKAHDGASLVWALTLAWTTVLNLYVGIYDAVILVPSAILAADVIFGLREPRESGKSVEFKYLLLLLFVTPWFTEFVAFATHIQVMTLVIAAYGFYLMRPQWVRTNSPALTGQPNTQPSIQRSERTSSEDHPPEGLGENLNI